MKMRHSSEKVFFEHMAASGFEVVLIITQQLPGDAKPGEENVEIYAFQLKT